MKPTTLLGTLVLLSTWSSVGATEAGTYSFQKADALIDLIHRPQVALLLLFLGDSLGGHGYLQGSD